MSARRSPVERDARRLAAVHLRIDREHRGDRTARELLDSAAASLAVDAARAVLRGDMPDARRSARAHQLVADSRDRLGARRRRELDAECARRAAAHGITVGAVVRIARTGQVPAGTVCTIENVLGNILYTTVDGVLRMAWAADVELVDEPDPIPDSRIEDEPADDVTPSSRVDAGYPIGSQVTGPGGLMGEVTAVRAGNLGIVVCVAVENSPIRQWWRVDQVERTAVPA